MFVFVIRKERREGESDQPYLLRRFPTPLPPGKVKVR